MEKEVKAIKVDGETNETKKVEKNYKKKDLIITAIIAFLIGAIITAGGFAINKNINGKRAIKEFRQDGIQRSLGPGERNNNSFKFQNKERSNNQNLPNNNQQQDSQTPPSNQQQQDSQTPPSNNQQQNGQTPPSNNQQPNNQAQPNMPNSSNNQSTTNKT